MSTTTEMKLEDRVFTGDHFSSGNKSAAEGAIAAGVCGYFGYPITPSSSLMEHIVKRLPKSDPTAKFLQCEDEIASITATIGCSWTRRKSMTSTSGPGFSLMQEGIGLAVFTETPLVLINVQRGGPSTGLPTFPGQQEMMQSHFGSHGDYIVPTLAPASVQECFDLTVEAFNASEALRTPVFVNSDQVLSSLYERFTIPDKSKLEIINRGRPGGPDVVWKGETISKTLVPHMNCFGEEKKAFSTGLSHDETGHVNLTPDVYENLMHRLNKKIITYQHLLPKAEEYMTDGAETIIVAYGSTARAAKLAVKTMRQKGTKVGLFRLRTLWPFPKEDLVRVCQDKRVLVVEISAGQLIWPVERFLHREVEHLGHLRGVVPPPSLIQKYVNKEVKS